MYFNSTFQYETLASCKVALIRQNQLAPIQFFVMEMQSRIMLGPQIIDSNRRRFAIDVNHPVQLLRWLLFSIADGGYHTAVSGVENGEVVARMLVSCRFQDVMRVCAIYNFHACAGRKLLGNEVKVRFFVGLLLFNHQLDTNIYLWDPSKKDKRSLTVCIAE